MNEKQWEYWSDVSFLMPPDRLIDDLNRHGRDGWECFQMIDEHNMGRVTIFLKREVTK